MDSDLTASARDKSDCLLALLRSQQDHLKQTRDIEFKVNLGLWTAIVVAGGFVHTAGIRLESDAALAVYCVIVVVIWLFHLLLWMVPIQYSADVDKDFVLQYRREVERLCDFRPEYPVLEPKWFWAAYERLRRGGWSWILAEAWITLVLVACLGIVLWASPPKSEAQTAPQNSVPALQKPDVPRGDDSGLIPSN